MSTRTISTCAPRRRSASRAGRNSEFANYVVELHDGDLHGLGEAAPNRRYGESRADGLAYLDAHAGEIEALDGPAAVEELLHRGERAPARRCGRR